jgi:dTDP-glucose 4,6-dehydratase
MSEGLSKEIGNVDYILHMAAETHVDNSIKNPVPFVQNNVNSTLHLLEYARTLSSLKKFFYFSTDEVYGPALNNILFTEDARHNPCNPYSASKSAAEQICNAYRNTYKIPVLSVNVMNAFGERQHIEKFIPKVIKQVLKGDKVSIHSYPDKITPGSRFYIHARNIADAVLFLINNGKVGESYNVSGEQEVNNLNIALMIGKIMQKSVIYELVDFHSDRPGHDLRYGLDGDKLKQLGWVPPVTFESGLKKCVEWTIQNQEWLEE